MNVVELKNVTKDYVQGELTVHALRGFDLTIGQGEFTAICGPSGSGKTTTINIIGALDKPIGPTLRRSTAAGGHRPGHRLQPGGGARRRTNRQRRFRDGG